jgi:hypothetical protein
MMIELPPIMRWSNDDIGGEWDLAMGLLPDVGFIGEKWVDRLTKITLYYREKGP